MKHLRIATSWLALFASCLFAHESNAFIGPHNPASAHPMEVCYIGNPPSIHNPTSVYLRLNEPAGLDIDEVIEQACRLFETNESNGPNRVVFDPCSRVIKSSLGLGEGARSFEADGAVTLFPKSGGPPQGPYTGPRGLATCTCTEGPGAGSGNRNIGNDGMCYCAAGQNWNPATRLCEAVTTDHHVKVTPAPKAEPIDCAKNAVSDPINPSNGAVIKQEGDCSTGGALRFGRFYNSMDTTATDIGAGWRRGFSRKVNANHHTITLSVRDATNPDHSAAFSTAEAACLGGFPQIRDRLANWAGATSVYENGLCKLIKDGRVIAWLPIHQSAGVPLASPTPISYDVTRDDGHVIRFWNQGGTLISSAGVTLRLQQIPGGYELRDPGDNVERYDSNGRLLSITSRAGVAQTMGYDTNGRLSAVTDSFGHRLVFGYDTQNRLISVTRE